MNSKEMRYRYFYWMRISNEDVYYGARYQKHNFIRASNQLVLLEKLIEHENELVPLINRILSTNE